MSTPETYPVEIAGIHRDLRLFQVAPGLRIAILNILGDTELVQACASALAARLKSVDYDVLITAEAKSIPLAYALSVETKKPYVVLRKSYKAYMGDALQAETLSITTGKPQTLILDEKDRALITGKKVLIVDDVISTGSTLQGIRMIGHPDRRRKVRVGADHRAGAFTALQGLTNPQLEKHSGRPTGHPELI
jgi:adenine phosphoribosyltransferase